MKVSKLNFSKLIFGCLLAALLLLFACNPQPKKEAEPKMMDQEAEKVDAPKEIISLDEAKALCDNYETRRIPSILKFERTENGAEEKFVPTQFVAFDLETIKSYITYVEQESKKANVQPDSLRIYLGNYGKEGRDPNRNTVFILPTAEIGKEYGGFYMDGTEAKLIRNYWPNGANGGQEGEPKSKASFVPTLNASLMQGGRSLIMNVGNGGPPPYGDF